MSLKLRKITSKNCHNCCAPLVEYQKPYDPTQTQKGQGTPKSSSFVYGTPKATNKSPADVSKHGGRRSSCDLLTRSPVPSIKHCVCACLIVSVFSCRVSCGLKASPSQHQLPLRSLFHHDNSTDLWGSPG